MSSNTTVTVAEALASADCSALAITGATVEQLEALADRVLGHCTIEVRDHAACISADLAQRGSSAILALLPHITDIEVSDGGTIMLTAAQLLTGGVDDDAHSALSLARGGKLAITEASVAQLSHLGRLPVVPDHIDVADGAEAVLAHLDVLLGMDDRISVTITNRWLDAAQVPPLARLGSRLRHGVPVRDTGMTIAAVAQSGDAAAIAYMNAHGALLRADATVTIPDVETLSRLTGFSKAGRALIVWDSAARLTAGGTSDILTAARVDAVHLRASSGDVTLRAAAAAALFALPGFSAANPDGSANRVTVSDSAAEIDSVAAQLAAAGSDIHHIVVHESGTVHEATLRRLQALGARLEPGVTLSVRDTAIHIAAAATTAGQSLEASSWRLSRGGMVTIADALALARRPHFSTAPYLLTLAGDAVLSAAEARALANLGSGLSPGGHKLTVRDTASHILGAAASGAWGLATSLTLSGAETVTAATAQALLREPKFVLTSALTVADNATLLLNPALRAAIEASPFKADIHCRLAAAETVPEAVAAALAGLPNFADTAGYLTVSAEPERGRPNVILGPPDLSFETAATGSPAGPMSWVAHRLTRAGAAPAEDVARQALADVSAQIAGGDGVLPEAADEVARGPSEFATLRADTVPPREHIVAAVLAHAGVVDEADMRAVFEAGGDRARVNVYGESGSLLSATEEGQEGFVVTAPDRTAGQAFSVTESINGRESAPVVVLDAATLRSAVAAANAQFAETGAIEVQSGQFLDLYTAGNVPVLDRPALVYDPSAHSVALDIPGQAPVRLIVLGASAPPQSLDVSEVLVRQAS